MNNNLKQYFTPTNYRYNSEVSPSVKFCKYMGDEHGRIEYRFPNGDRDYFYGTKKYAKTKKDRAWLLLAFEQLLRNGYFPQNKVSKLGQKKKTTSGHVLSLENCVQIYYGRLNYGASEKKDKVIKSERPTLLHLLCYFTEVLSLSNISDITSNHLKRFDAEIKQWCENKKNRKIKSSTIKSYKKITKAFFNRMSREYDFKYNTSKIDCNIYFSGKTDSEAYRRSVFIPTDLLNSVDLIEVVFPKNQINYIELIHFLRTTGICKEELATISEDNLYPSVENFDSISIFNKPDCPTRHGLGLSLKSKNRERIIPLDSRSVAFIEFQKAKHKTDLIFGQVGQTKEDVQYRFLFPIRRNGQWRRCDNYLRGIKSILAEANNIFSLGYDVKTYQLHDFRRTLNNELGDHGVLAEDRSYLLGHDKKVNESNYSNYQKQKEQRRARASKALRNHQASLVLTHTKTEEL